MILRVLLTLVALSMGCRVTAQPERALGARVERSTQPYTTQPFGGTSAAERMKGYQRPGPKVLTPAERERQEQIRQGLAGGKSGKSY